MRERIRLHLTFTGHVQGTGFRYTALETARKYQLYGYVRNLANGRVEAEAEGGEATVRAFIAELQKTARFRVTYTAEYEVPLRPEEDHFSIR